MINKLRLCLACVLALGLFVNYLPGDSRILSICLENFCSPGERIFPVHRSNAGRADINIRIDPGRLGDFANINAVNAVQEAFSVWNNVPDASVQFNNIGPIEVEVNGTNFDPILNPQNPLGFSVMVFDDNGEILRELGGLEVQETVLGFAGATFTSTNPQTGEINIAEGQVLINGNLFELANRQRFSSQAELLENFRSVIFHEIGHLMGLDHLQGGHLDKFIADSNGEIADLSLVPIMFPISVNPNLAPTRDDLASVGFAYPATTFNTRFGTIRGFLRGPSGEPIFGANVVAYNVNDPNNENVSSSTDVFFQGDGEFILPGLIPGTYALKVEPIFPTFEEASSVGQRPPPSENELNSFPNGFYLGPEDGFLATTINDGVDLALPVTVTAGQTTNINIEPLNDVQEDTFTLSGSLFTRSIGLRSDGRRGRRSIIKRFRISNANPDNGAIRVNLSIDSPARVVPSRVALGRRSKIVSVVIPRSTSRFANVFPTFLIDGANITLRATDTTNDTSQEATINVNL